MWVILALSFLMGELAYRLLQNNFQGHHLVYQVVLFGSYIPCYVAGMAVAKLDLNRVTRLALMATGLGIIVLWSIIPVFNSHLGLALFFMGLTALALIAGTRTNRFLERYLMIWVGERSYSLFLLHHGVMIFIAYLVSLVALQNSLGYYMSARGIGFPLGMLASMLLFSLVERRFARGLVTGNDFFPWSKQ